MSRSLLVVAGEVSGDQHAAAVVRRVRESEPNLRVWGIGGDALAEAGVALRRHTRDMAVMGLSEVLRRFSFFRRALREIAAEARRDPPDAALLVDYPGFNFRLAARLRGLRTRIVYYICPQVWAWRRSRIARLKRLADRLLVIFPFEASLFEGSGPRTEFVGHPLVDEARAARAAPDPDLPWSGSHRVALLPGSREQEIVRILPSLAAAAWWLRNRRPETSFLVAAPSEELAAAQRRLLRAQGAPEGLLPVVAGQTRPALRQARAAWVASGTATVEACLMGCPMVVVYRTSALTYAAARRVVRVPRIGMVNLIAGREICPERIQREASPRRLVEAIEPLLDDTPERARMLEDLKTAASRLGDGGAADRAARAVLEELAGGASR